MNNIKLELEFSIEHFHELIELAEICGLKTQQELLNNALSILRWAVAEVRKGNTIASVNEANKTYCEIKMDTLTKAAEHKIH